MQTTQSSHRLPLWAALTAGALLFVPLVALAIVPVYSRETPRLWGFPFFYWYELLWVILAPLFTYSAHRLILHVRRPR